MDERIARVRSDLDADFTPRAARARLAWPVRITETEIVGVSCQVVTPEQGEPEGTLLYFFGGGYVSGAPEYDLHLTAALATYARRRVIAPRYALAPEHPFPAGFNQCCAVCAALADKAPLDLGGESAGGGMALAVAGQAIRNGQKPPSSLALFGPWIDLTEEGIALSAGIDDKTITLDDLRAFAAAYQGTSPLSDPRMSPLYDSYDAAFPPTILTTGARDLLQPTIHALHGRLRDAGVRCDLIDKPGMWHAFEVYDEAPEADASLRAVARFIVGAAG